MTVSLITLPQPSGALDYSSGDAYGLLPASLPSVQCCIMLHLTSSQALWLKARPRRTWMAWPLSKTCGFLRPPILTRFVLANKHHGLPFDYKIKSFKIFGILALNSLYCNFKFITFSLYFSLWHFRASLPFVETDTQFGRMEPAPQSESQVPSTLLGDNFCQCFHFTSHPPYGTLHISIPFQFQTSPIWILQIKLFHESSTIITEFDRILPSVLVRIGFVIVICICNGLIFFPFLFSSFLFVFWLRYRWKMTMDTRFLGLGSPCFSQKLVSTALIVPQK